MSASVESNRKEGGIVFHTAEMLDAKRKQQVARATREEEVKKITDPSLPLWPERVHAATATAVETGKIAYEKFREKSESLLASKQSSNAHKKLEAFERGPDVRNTDEIHYQHDTTPKDVNNEKKGRTTLIENRAAAIQSRQKASDEESKKLLAQTKQKYAATTKDKLVEGYKSKVAIVHQQTHKTTAAVHNHKADQEAQELYGAVNN